MPGAGVAPEAAASPLYEATLEPAWVVERVAEISGSTPAEVERFLSAVHHVVDALTTDDVLVVAFPLVVGRIGCPIWERFRYLVKGDWDDSLDVFDGSSHEIAQSLSLPLALVEQYPTAGLGTLLVQTVDHLGLTAKDDLKRSFRMLQAWVDTYELPGGGLRSYRVRPVGRERPFEDWLVQNLEVLAEHDYPVRLADQDRDGVPGRQAAVHGRRSIADLVCVLAADTEEMRAGDLLVVENKTTAVDVGVADQLARYVDFLGASAARPVHGLLIADGLTVDAGRAVAERGFGYLSLAAIGYRDHLRGTAGVPEWDPDDVAAAYAGTLTAPGPAEA